MPSADQASSAPAPHPAAGPPEVTQELDVVVVGGGPAGLSAALVLGRARRSSLVIDAGQPRNAPSTSVHGYLTRDGADPADVRAAGRGEVRSYGIEIVEDEVIEVRRADADERLLVRTVAGRFVRARRVIVATGLTDELPDIPGVAERWGRDVLHCPYCHGYEVRDGALATIAADRDGAVHQALLLRQWSADVTLFLNAVAPEEIRPEETELLAARGVTLVHGPVAAIRITDDHVSGVELADGRVLPRSAVFIAPTFRVNDALLGRLDVDGERSDLGRGVVVDDEGRTSVPGIWAVGNLADLSAQVTGSVESGARAAIGINGELCQEDAERALAAARARR